MFRQGDVLIVPVSTLPRGGEKQSHCTVALGEMTGHSHRVAAGATQFVMPDGTQYLVVHGPVAELIHEEHATIYLPGPSVYRIVHQREYVPGRYSRPVQD